MTNEDYRDGFGRGLEDAAASYAKSSFTEDEVLTPAMREQMDAFYDRIDADLAGENGRGAW